MRPARTLGATCPCSPPSSVTPVWPAPIGPERQPRTGSGQRRSRHRPQSLGDALREGLCRVQVEQEEHRKPGYTKDSRCQPPGVQGKAGESRPARGKSTNRASQGWFRARRRKATLKVLPGWLKPCSRYMVASGCVAIDQCMYWWGCARPPICMPAGIAALCALHRHPVSREDDDLRPRGAGIGGHTRSGRTRRDSAREGRMQEADASGIEGTGR